MGYTTEFTGSIKLSRKLTFDEAKYLLDNYDPDDRKEDAKEIRSLSYLQWVPSVDLKHIVWDGNEKFYDYLPLLEWLCGWLKDRSISANGKLLWRGEDERDMGEITVENNAVIVEEVAHIMSAHGSLGPLTLAGLQKMELEKLAGQAGQ